MFLAIRVAGDAFRGPEGVDHTVVKDGVIVMGVYQADSSEQGCSILAISRDKKLLWRLVNGDKNMMSMLQAIDFANHPAVPSDDRSLRTRLPE